MQSNKYGNGKWIHPGQSITIAGETISCGMIYVGTSLMTPCGAFDPCLIDLSKQVSAEGDYTRKKINNFPSYLDISKEARRVYLNWLAGNRSEPKIDIGYVFLFLAGLERRVVFDSAEDQAVQSEWPIIAEELCRLLSIYSQKSVTFTNCTINLLNWISLVKTTPSKLYENPFPSFLKTFDLPLYLQIALGQAAMDRAPISKELALAWVTLDSEFNKPILDIYRTKQFDALFMSNYENKFGTGIILSKNKKRLKIKKNRNPKKAIFC